MTAIRPSERMRHAFLWCLAFLTIAALSLRVLSIAEPLGIDQSLWASAASGMSHGQRLYRDVWEQRPPGIYWIYVAGFQLFGHTPQTVAWLDVLASTATCLLLASAAARLANPLAGSLVAALYAVLTMPSWLYSHNGFLERSVCETFISTCVALGAWCAVHTWRRDSLAAAVTLGLSSGMAVMLKPNAGLYLPALLIWLVAFRGRTGAAKFVIAAIAASAVVPVIGLWWLWQGGLLDDARVAVLDFNRFYVAQGFAPGTYLVDFSKAVWLRIKTDPLWLAGIVGSAAAVFDLFRRKLPPLAGLALTLGAAALLVIVMNGARLFNSYFINALPPLSLMAGWMLSDALAKGRGRRVLALCTTGLMIGFLFQRGYAERVFGWARTDLDQLRGRSDANTYLERFGGYDNRRGYSARANAELADYVRRHTSSEERIFLFGISGAGVYFGSDRLTAHRFLRVNFFVETDFPDPRFRLGPVLSDLAAVRPRYLIFERLHGTSPMAQAADRLPDDPAVQALLSGYTREAEIEDFTLYRRSD